MTEPSPERGVAAEVAEGSGQGPEVIENLPTYVIQVSGVRVYEFTARRTPNGPDDPAGPGEPDIRLELLRDWVAPDRKRFRVVYAIHLRHQYNRTQTLNLDCSIEAGFTTTAPIGARRFSTFREREALVLLWPYLRATLSELTRLLEVRLPPLPMLDVRKVVGPRRRRSQSES